MPADPAGEPLLCVPCLAFPPRHDQCQPIPWCSCWTELLLEAEQKEDP